MLICIFCTDTSKIVHVYYEVIIKNDVIFILYAWFTDLIRPFAENVHNYNLRQQISFNNFRLPHCNTVSYYKSFLPSTLRLWNELPTSIKSSPSVESFKKNLSFDLPKIKNYFNFGNRKENIIYCQLRNDASNLNLHLFNHHLTDTKCCPHCNDPCENPTHFFIHCPAYADIRQLLLNTFHELGVEFNIQNILYGCDTLRYVQNEILISAVPLYIKNSGRFE